jgi:hypothetical protein
MKKKLTQHSLFQSIEDAIPVISDHRSQNRTTHSIRDAISATNKDDCLQNPQATDRWSVCII